MRKMKLLVPLLFAAFLLSSGSTMAGVGNNGLSGAHWQFNIIGHPKGVDAISGDESNGRAIMVPLKNAVGPNEIVCEAEEFVITPDNEPTFTDQEPVGAKIHFRAGQTFNILDRDATDGNGATIVVPTVLEDGEPVLAVNIYVRVLGKPNTCMDIDGYAYDQDQALWFWSGSVDLNRKTGRSSWVDVRELFDVWFCQVDELTGACTAGTEEELSVFNNVFEDYFWNILNNGTRIVQVRLYPITN
ncbi:MAG: hypothetical protein AB1640_20245 [bacterium]